MSIHTISEVSKLVTLSAHTLRFYEKKGLLPYVERDSSGRRAYKAMDISVINFIKALRGTGMSLSRIKEYGKMCLNDDTQGRHELLLLHKEEILAKLAKHKVYLKVIEAKIEKAGTQGKC
jgi:DNA-binding transcriptional MerR regulator